MRLGELLTRDGRMTAEQLQQALAAQEHEGGRIGTAMVEMGLLDMDTLTIYLGLEMGIPIASGAALEKAKRMAVQLLTPEQAAKFQCVPIVVQDRQLIVAVPDPNDMVSLDEIARVTGYRVIPRVAPEARIHYYIERYYGVPRPKRFTALGDFPRGNKPVPAGLPAPPLPGLPPRTEAPIKPPTRAPELNEHPVTENELVSEDSALLEELDEDATAPAETVKKQVAKKSAPPPPRTPTKKPPRKQIMLGDALDLLKDASERHQIAEAVLAFAGSSFEVCFLGVVRDNYLFGWLGEGIAEERLETVLIPLDAPTLFKQATEADHGYYQGSIFPSTLHKHFLKVLEVATPEVAFAFPIKIGDRVVNFFYAQAKEPLGEDFVEDLKKVANAASDAYVGLIRRQKRVDAPE